MATTPAGSLPNGSPPPVPGGFTTAPDTPNPFSGYAPGGPYTGFNPRVNNIPLDQFQVVDDTKIAPRFRAFSSRSVFDTLPDDQLDSFIDQNWVEKAFITGDIQLNPVDAENRYYSSASLKFTNSTMGGNIGINARPQFTRYADIRVPGRYPGVHKHVTVGTKDNIGMGRYYSEAIDDNAQLIYLRFGVPAFNSFGNFFANMYSYADSELANTGRIPILFDITTLLTSVAFFVYFPMLATIIFGVQMLENFFSLKSNQYYYLKPTMHAYWSGVNTLINIIATNLDLLVPQLTDKKSQQMNTPYIVPQSYLSALHTALPEIFNSEYGIDAYAIANKAQRMANMAWNYQYQSYNKLNPVKKLRGYVGPPGTPAGQHTTYSELLNWMEIGDYSLGSANTPIPQTPGNQHLQKSKAGHLHDFYSYLSLVADTPYYKSASKGTGAHGQPSSETIFLVDHKTGQARTAAAAKKDIDSVGNMLEAEFDDGSMFATFRVNFTGQGTLSYSHSVGQPGIASVINSYASNIRSKEFDFEGGNIGGIVQDPIDWLKTQTKAIANGVLQGSSIDGMVNLLLGNVRVEIPDYWEDASVSFPTSNYEMDLVSPYGNVISQIQNIYLPLSMIMAGSLPLATGKSSYTSPFICQLYDRGHNQMQLGIIDSVSIDYGTTNLPYTRWGRPLGVKVSFSVVNLTKIMSMPLAAGTLWGTGHGFFTNINQDSPLGNFLAIITGRDIYSQIYVLPRAKMRLATAMKNIYSFTQPARWMSYLNQNINTGVLSWMVLPSAFAAMQPGLSTPAQQLSPFAATNSGILPVG
jgi:hypothetical protein